jgi:hypothetical protein
MGLIESSGHHNGVTALSWAIIAAHRLRDLERRERYGRTLDAIGKNTVAHRHPLFFSPLWKGLLELEDLEKELDKFSK